MLNSNDLSVIRTVKHAYFRQNVITIKGSSNLVKSIYSARAGEAQFTQLCVPKDGHLIKLGS